LEVRVKEHKATLKEKKKTAEDLKQQLSGIAMAVCEAHAKLSFDFADAMELVQSIQELETEMKEIEARNASDQIQHARTQEESTRLIAEQAQDIEVLERELQEWQAKALAAEGELNMAEAQVSGMSKQLSETQAQLQEAEQVARNRDVNLEYFADWLSEARRVLGQVVGVESITVKPPATLHLTFRARQVWTMTVAIHSDRTERLVDIQVCLANHCTYVLDCKLCRTDSRHFTPS
jgi:chromosome segregation ATPase